MKNNHRNTAMIHGSGGYKVFLWLVLHIPFCFAVIIIVYALKYITKNLKKEKGKTKCWNWKMLITNKEMKCMTN